MPSIFHTLTRPQYALAALACLRALATAATTLPLPGAAAAAALGGGLPLGHELGVEPLHADEQLVDLLLLREERGPEVEGARLLPEARPRDHTDPYVVQKPN